MVKMNIELVNRKELGDIDYFITEYGWLRNLDDKELVDEVIATNNVQNAIFELLNFVNDVIGLSIVSTEYPDDYYGDSNIENTDAWLDMN